MYKLVAKDLSKRFGRRKVFTDISFEVQTGDVMAVVGPNGSGKSTMLMTLLGRYLPTKGTITFSEDKGDLDSDQVRDATSLVSPYLHLYDNLSGEENMVFFATVAGIHLTGKEIAGLLERVGLEGRGEDYVAAYSSGMKQRLKYAVALLSEPAYLFLDEPTSNLDEQGKKIVFDLIEEYKDKSVVIIATNEKEETGIASKICRVAG